ncbi:hypothetical protein A6R68_13571 [Neotoma lepida]|uniref:Enolase N-terminal domain-containing protein n=1 Tax=Neotoma lepida TaxID=56216 RepID=A0A1A6H212_NEOLE|nr:hypothetical protein A6R68_13571 [Neotoma lepida]
MHRAHDSEVTWAGSDLGPEVPCAGTDQTKKRIEEKKKKECLQPLLLSCMVISTRKFTMSIFKIHWREIFDSPGNLTVEVNLCTQKVSKKTNAVEKHDKLMIKMDGTENKSKLGALPSWGCPWLSEKGMLWKRGCTYIVTLMTELVTPKLSCQFWLSKCSTVVLMLATSWP